MAIVNVGCRLGRIEPFAKVRDLTIEDEVELWGEVFCSTVGIAPLDSLVMLSSERHGDGVLLCVTCRCGGIRSSVAGRRHHSRCSRRRWSQCTSCCGRRGGRLGAASGGLEERAACDATRGVGHRGLWRRATITSAASPLLLLALLELRLPLPLELQEELELLLLCKLPTVSSATVALWPPLLGCRLLWRSSAAIRANSRATTHPGRGAVVGVEQDRVLVGAKACASLGPQTAVVTVPRGLRSRVLERQVGSVSVRRAGRAPINRRGLHVEKAGTKCPTNSV